MFSQRNFAKIFDVELCTTRTLKQSTEFYRQDTISEQALEMLTIAHKGKNFLNIEMPTIESYENK